MKKLLVIVNPKAGDGKHLQLLADAVSLSSDAECTFTHFASVASRDQAWLRRHDAVIVFGGDGTLNSWLATLAKARVPTAIYPAGTVNNLAHELGIGHDWNQLRQMLETERFEPLPLLSVNDRMFSSYGTLGVGAENSRYMHQTRARMRTLRRAFPMLQTPIFALRTILLSNDYMSHVRIKVNGGSKEIVTPGIYITNQARLNKYIELGWQPAAHPNEFLVVLLKDRGRRALLQTCGRLYARADICAVRDDIDVYKASSLQIESVTGTPLSFFGDGEPLVSSSKLEIRVAPEALLAYRQRPHAASIRRTLPTSDSIQA